jgi:hypothetical protein
MSAISSDWAPAETDTPIARAVESGKFYQREEEFRSALAKYMAGYIAEQQKRGAAEIVAGQSRFTVVRRLAGWIRGGQTFART